MPDHPPTSSRPVATTRRTLLQTSSLALGGLGLAAAAQAAGPEQQPPALFGTTKGGEVSLPPLQAPSEVQGSGPPNPDPTQRRLGIAVVGLGHLSLEQILPGLGQARHVRLAALVSGRPEKARAVAAQYGLAERNIYDYRTYDRIKDNPDIDIVYVVLPNALHAEYTVRAAQAGKHVLCEKPMATSVAEAETMVDACRAAGRRLMIAYRCQYEPYNRAMIEMARSGRYGPLRSIMAVNGQDNAANGQWRHIKALAGGGSLPDVGLYCLNATRYITGEEPVEITAQMTQPKDDPRFREVEDIMSFTLRFPSGVIATCASGYSHHESRRYRVMAADGWFELDPGFAYQGLRMRIGTKAGKAHAYEERVFTERNQFALEMDHFADAIRQNKVPHTPGEEGLQDQRLMAAIYEAAAGGQAVRLPPVQGLDTTRGPAPTEES